MDPRPGGSDGCDADVGRRKVNELLKGGTRNVLEQNGKIFFQIAHHFVNLNKNTVNTHKKTVYGHGNTSPRITCARATIIFIGKPNGELFFPLTGLHFYFK